MAQKTCQISIYKPHLWNVKSQIGITSYNHLELVKAEIVATNGTGWGHVEIISRKICDHMFPTAHSYSKGVKNILGKFNIAMEHWHL